MCLEHCRDGPRAKGWLMQSQFGQIRPSLFCPRRAKVIKRDEGSTINITYGDGDATCSQGIASCGWQESKKLCHGYKTTSKYLMRYRKLKINTTLALDPPIITFHRQSNIVSACRCLTSSARVTRKSQRDISQNDGKKPCLIRKSRDGMVANRSLCPLSTLTCCRCSSTRDLQDGFELYVHCSPGHLL